MKFKNNYSKVVFLNEIAENIEPNILVSPSREMLDKLNKKRLPILSAISCDYTRGSELIKDSLSNKKVRHNSAITNYITAKDLTTMTTVETLAFIKALSSLNTHILIEMEYYHGIYQTVSLDTLYEQFNVLNQKITKLFIKNKSISLSESDTELLISLVETSALINSFAKKSGKSAKDIDALWNKIKSKLLSSGKSETDNSFYPILVSILKKQLNLV